MSNNTFMFWSVTTTVFIAVAVVTSGYAVHHWFCVWREPQARHKALAKGQLYEHLAYFLMVLIWFVLRMVAWFIGAVSLANSSPIGVYTGVILSFLALVVGSVAGGVANGYFSNDQENKHYTDFEPDRDLS